MAAWEPKSLHKLHCYLGQTTVSKHVADLEPQVAALSSDLAPCVCAHSTHTQLLYIHNNYVTECEKIVNIYSCDTETVTDRNAWMFVDSRV